MSTRARFEVTDNNGKTHILGIYKDAYPEGVIPRLPNTRIDFEDFRKRMKFEDMSSPIPDYYYETSLPKSQVNIYESKYGKDGKFYRGELLFQGTFAEAKEKYLALN